MRLMKLTQESFHGWLESYGPDFAVGHSQSVCDCPLANYITESSGSEARVGQTKYKTEDMPHHKHLPAWAKRFVDTIDREHWGWVSAQTCLKILDSIK